MKKKNTILFLLLPLLFLFGCNKNQAVNIPENSPENGIVKGILHTKNEIDKIGLVLYLGDVITDTNGMDGGFLKIETAPVAIFDESSGEFIFTNIEPGEYSLIIKEVVFGGKLLVDDSGNARIIEVVAGETIDLGVIDFEGF